ncbi:uncharacterized protein BYT42DRAFT_581003 [Radiomyces spectabilis]|uniref:uncharacterized protein n=1 Tax=Radiomyces spectabilis TaxID=64574 RepID=UPI002220D6EE|nr:uncharacterized protein BYT42DRAFT_581003 [Radiomyces spectabilis]KAI8371653.1 hypothetical protein BYT42DRAFT_581003 [Radiomyces spectabilis]
MCSISLSTLLIVTMLVHELISMLVLISISIIIVFPFVCPCFASCCRSTFHLFISFLSLSILLYKLFLFFSINFITSLTFCLFRFVSSHITTLLVIKK